MRPAGRCGRRMATRRPGGARCPVPEILGRGGQVPSGGSGLPSCPATRQRLLAMGRSGGSGCEFPAGPRAAKLGASTICSGLMGLASPSPLGVAAAPSRWSRYIALPLRGHSEAAPQVESAVRAPCLGWRRPWVRIQLAAGGDGEDGAWVAGKRSQRADFHKARDAASEGPSGGKCSCGRRACLGANL